MFSTKRCGADARHEVRLDSAARAGKTPGVSSRGVPGPARGRLTEVAGRPQPHPAPGGSRLLCPGPATGKSPIDQEHNNGPEDGEEPGPQVKEVSEPSAKDQRADPTSEYCAHDANNECDQPAASLPAGKD